MTNPTTTNFAVEVEHIGPVPLTLAERGQGQPYLVLHGGGGSATVAGFADLLAQRRSARVLTPTHPGFGGTPRPELLATLRDLARVYVALLDALDLAAVTVIGNSIGGWIAAEMGLSRSPRLRSVVIIDGVGIEVPGHPVVDFFSLTFPEIAARSYYEPDKFRIDPTALAPAAQGIMATNRANLAVYAGTSMADPTLRGRLRASTLPTLIVWGESDRIADTDYGRAYADAIPAATFVLMTGAGHLPQLETPDALLVEISGFVDRLPATATPGASSTRHAPR